MKDRGVRATARGTAAVADRGGWARELRGSGVETADPAPKLVASGLDLPASNLDLLHSTVDLLDSSLNPLDPNLDLLPSGADLLDSRLDLPDSALDLPAPSLDLRASGVDLEDSEPDLPASAPRPRIPPPSLVKRAGSPWSGLPRPRTTRAERERRVPSAPCAPQP